MHKLPQQFYRNSNIPSVARSLLGKKLCSFIDNEYTAALIVETEAYTGVDDRASHAYGARRTARTEVMYQTGGVAYVYLCYGIHYLFNVIAGPENNPSGVLIRAVEPVAGIDIMLQRRKMTQPGPRVSAGPGLVTQAMGIGKQHKGARLSGETLWIEDAGVSIKAADIVTTTRIGVDYAGPDALLPYRFYIRGNPYVSRK